MATWPPLHAMTSNTTSFVVSSCATSALACREVASCAAATFQVTIPVTEATIAATAAYHQMEASRRPRTTFRTTRWRSSGGGRCREAASSAAVNASAASGISSGRSSLLSSFIWSHFLVLDWFLRRLIGDQGLAQLLQAKSSPLLHRAKRQAELFGDCRMTEPNEVRHDQDPSLVGGQTTECVKRPLCVHPRECRLFDVDALGDRRCDERRDLVCDLGSSLSADST